MINLAAAAAEPDRGWGGPLALLAAVIIFIAISQGWEWWQARKIDTSSPPLDDPDTMIGVNPQVRTVSDTDDTDTDTIHEWGRVSRARQRMKVIRGWVWAPKEAVDDVDQAGAEGVPLEEFVAELDRAGVPYAQIVRRSMQHYGVSEATAKRRIRDARTDRDAAR